MSQVSQELPLISPDCLQEIMGVTSLYIEGRSTLDEKHNKRMELLRFSSGEARDAYSVFVKYVYADSIVQEIMVYDAFLRHHGSRVPKMIGHRASSDGLHVLVLEFLDGFNPEFNNKSIVNTVFEALGGCSSAWRLQAMRYVHGDNKYQTDNHILQDRFERFIQSAVTKEVMIRNLKETSRIANDMEQTVQELGGTELYEALLDVGGEIGEIFAEYISRMPLTLDSRDISVHNVIHQTDDKFWFVDFEYRKLCPVAFVVDVLGESWGSLPNDALTECAIRSFLEGWNKDADIRLEWEDFMVSYKCVRVHWKSHEFKHSMSDWLKDKNNHNQSQWVIDKGWQLINLVKDARSTVYH